MNRCAFLDRDGVINVDHGYVSRLAQIDWIDGFFDAFLCLKKQGYKVIVITNQSGVARGFYKISDVKRLHHQMNDIIFSKTSYYIDAFYFCPFHPNAAISKYKHFDHPDRKPNSGMLRRAISEFDADINTSFMIGDKETDILAATKVGVSGHLFRGGCLNKFLGEIL